MKKRNEIIDHWDWIELIADILGEPVPEKDHIKDVLEDQFCERYGISDYPMFLDLMDILLDLTPTVSGMLGDETYHAFVDDRRRMMKPKSDIKSAPPYVRAYLDALRHFNEGKTYDEAVNFELEMIPGHPEITEDQFLSALAGVDEAWTDHQALTEPSNQEKGA